MTVEELQVLITANTTALKKEINKTNQTISNLQKTANKTQNGVTSAFKKLKSGIVALGIGKVIADSITKSMNAIESDSLFDTSLGGLADDVRAWSDEIANALGLSATAMRKNTGVIYNMTTSMGVANDNALKMSKGITLLSEDMASFYNLSSEEAFNKLRAGITGETEPLKALGILVDENTIKQVAYQNGIANTGAELTQQQKVLARYVAILQQTGNAQGDLARTINSPANQLRILKNQVSSLGTAFGNILIPVVSAVLPYLTALAKVVTLALNSLSKFLGLVSGGGTKGMANSIGDISSGIGDVGTGLNDANKSAKKLKGTLAGFDEMNVLQDTSTDSGGSAGGGGGVATGGALDFSLGDYDAHLDGLNSKVDKIVEQINSKFNTVAEVVKNIWNSEPIQAFSGAVVTWGQFIWDYWSQMGTMLFENISLTWTNIETNVGTILTNMTTLWTTFWTDVDAGIQTWGKPIIEGVTGVFDTLWKKAFDPYITKMTDIWADFTGILLDLWNEHGKPLIDNVGEFVVNLCDLFQSIYDNVIDPIITPFLEMLSWLWDKHLKGMITELGQLVMSVVNGALELYNKFIHPIITWLLDLLAPAWAKLTSGIIDTFGTMVALVVDNVKSVTKGLRGLVDFIVGTFTGNWKKAWKGIKTAFTSMFEPIINIAKAVINSVIDVLNSMIRGINKINFKVPDWVPVLGGKKVGLSVPTIPKLAKGGIITSPTYAMIGEAGREAVLPLDNNLGYLDKLAEKINSKGNGQPTQIVIKLGEDTIFEKFIDYTKEKSFETNGEVFSL